ncbi:MAG TPA: hypothetical protein VMV10_15260 [Pirellulales bacterium]|nr:hypothetical protein [Pirellulales bacterium]
MRIQAPACFTLHWTRDEWQRAEDARSVATALGIEYVDIATAQGQRAPIRFTFFWDSGKRWDGQDYSVDVVEMM